MVAKATDGDIFALIPETPYSAADLDWTDDSSRVSEEHNDTSKRNISLETVTPEDWDSYDTAFVGYPIWWGEAAYPVLHLRKLRYRRQRQYSCTDRRQRKLD